MTAPSAPAPQQEPPPAFVEDDSKPPLSDLVRAQQKIMSVLPRLTRRSARAQLTVGDAQAAEAVLLRPPGCLPPAATPPPAQKR